MSKPNKPMKANELGPLRFAPWAVAACLLLGGLLWASYRESGSSAPAAMLDAALWVGKCEGAAELTAEALQNPGRDFALLSQAAASCQRVRGEMPTAPGPWFPTEEAERVLNALDKRISVAWANRHFKRDWRPESSKLLADAATLRGAMQVAIADTTSRPAAFVGLLPGDWLFLLLLACGFIALGLWYRATHRETVNHLEREKRQLLDLATVDTPRALQKCHDLSRQFLETAHQVLQRQQSTNS